MDIQYLPYDPQYDIEIIHCLQRNYPWMGRRSEAEIRAWASPILDYHFVAEDAYRYAHGLLVVADGHVVGFYGNIASVRDGVRNVNWTTWCMDAPYRFYTFPAIMTMLQEGEVDLYTDLTASPTVQEIDAQFGFRCVPGNTIQYRVHGSRKEHLSVILCQSTEDADHIKDPAMRIAFLDHLPYDVQCIIWSLHGEDQYLFVKRYQRRYLYNLLTRPFVRILESQTRELAGQDMDALLRYIAARYHVREIECDDAILACTGSAHVHYVATSTRMYRTADKAFPAHWSYLYSEVALLDE